MSKKKSYSKFTYKDLPALGLQVIIKPLFDTTMIIPLAPSAWLSETLALGQEVSLATEKAKSELIITPILSEIRRNNKELFSFYSGFNFDVDAARGLQGFCDFLLARLPLSVVPQTTIIAVVEAKHQQDLVDAVPQCAAEMYAATIFNEKLADKPAIIHGVVTSGYEWLFLKLEGHIISVNTIRYNLNNLPELLGVWQKVIDFYR